MVEHRPVGSPRGWQCGEQSNNKDQFHVPGVEDLLDQQRIELVSM